MDQLRKAWAWFVRHHFWVLTVVTVIVAAFCWYSGASALQQAFASNKSKIEQQFNSISTLRSETFKPNQDVNDKQQEQIDVQTKAVHALWQQLYDRQRDEVLKWPENLSDQFRNFVEGLKFNDPIPEDLRNHYNNYVRDHFPELPKIVGALLAPEGDGAGRGYSPRSMMGGRGDMRGESMMMGGLGGETVEEEEFIVEWLDQDRIRQQLYSPTTPSASRIWKTQEDLWVYEALLKIIAATNKAADADRFSNAAVRVIETIEVGELAARQSRTGGRIEIVQSAPQGGGEFGGEMMGGGDMGMGRGQMGGGEMMGGDMGMGRGGDFGGEYGGGMEGGATDDAIFANRYIGPDGLAMATAPGPEETFKRLPVRLQLQMDERWLQQLIAECANAPLQVDVQEVRINPMDSSSNSGYGGGRPSYSGSAGEAAVPDAEPHVKTVILQGIIYIFNPPLSAPPADSGQVAGVN